MVCRPIQLVARFTGAALLAAGVACNAIVGVEDAQLERQSPYDPPPSGLPTVSLCTNTCEFANDGECDDGGPGAEWEECDIGSDCGDCGSRSLAPDSTPVGDSCTADSQCTAIAEGYCPEAGICTRECETHTDCGCPSGTTNGDVRAGLCGAVCSDGYCFRGCYGNEHCEGPSECILVPGIGLCATM
jgi:hypothetical protein